jgi:hypothetical protein
MGLLGMLAAGAGGGIRDASNASVQAQNQLEIETARDNLREEFYTRRYNRERADQLTDAKSQGLLNQATYERNRADKLSDDETKHKRGIEIEGIKTGRTESANAARIKAAEIRAGGGPSSSGGSIGGDFNPKSPEGRAAMDLVNSGRVNDINEGYDEIQRMKLFTGLASNQFMTDPKQLFDFYDNFKRERAASSGNTQQQSATTRDRYDPKTGNIIIGGDSQEDVNAATQRTTEQQIRKPAITKPLLDNTQYDIPDIERNIPMNVIGESGMRRSNMNTKTGVSVDQRTGDLIVNEIDPETGKMISVRVDPKTMLPVK